VAVLFWLNNYGIGIGVAIGIDIDVMSQMTSTKRTPIPHCYTQCYKFATRFESRFTPGEVRIDRILTTETTEITEGECRDSCPGANASRCAIHVRAGLGYLCDLSALCGSFLFFLTSIPPENLPEPNDAVYIDTYCDPDADTVRCRALWSVS